MESKARDDPDKETEFHKLKRSGIRSIRDLINKLATEQSDLVPPTSL